MAGKKASAQHSTLGGGGGRQCVPALGNSCLAAAAFRDLCFVSFQIVRELAVFFDLSGS